MYPASKPGPPPPLVASKTSRRRRVTPQPLWTPAETTRLAAAAAAYITDRFKQTRIGRDSPRIPAGCSIAGVGADEPPRIGACLCCRRRRPGVPDQRRRARRTGPGFRPLHHFRRQGQGRRCRPGSAALSVVLCGGMGAHWWDCIIREVSQLMPGDWVQRCQCSEVSGMIAKTNFSGASVSA